MKSNPRTRLSLIAAALWIGLGVVFVGVGGDDPSRVWFHGTIHVDGQPLDHGTIQFFRMTQSPEPMSAGALVNHGHFALGELTSLAPGTYRVVISGLGVEGLLVAAGMEDESPTLTEPIPARYNRKSELLIDVPRCGTQHLHFDLKR
ncbi:MAG: hypothetical protein ACP5XB_18485 [Isosphaeraceae bacterium]